MVRIADKKRRQKNKLQPKPQWAEAFMLFLLAKAGGKANLSIEQLDAFSKIQGGNSTELTYDEDTKKVTLSLAVDFKVPEIVVPKKKIIT